MREIKSRTAWAAYLVGHGPLREPNPDPFNGWNTLNRSRRIGILLSLVLPRDLPFQPKVNKGEMSLKTDSWDARFSEW
jgi:hypothetical protein